MFFSVKYLTLCTTDLLYYNINIHVKFHIPLVPASAGAGVSTCAAIFKCNAGGLSKLCHKWV